jgi:benzodiazapine receptor
MRIPWGARLIVSIALCQSAGVIGSIFTRASVGTWYASLEKPFFSPPNWLFAPVWIALYTMMGIAFFIVWGQRGKRDGALKAMQVFLAQLIGTVLWCAAFFGVRSMIGGLLAITFLWALIAWTIFLFWRVSKPAAILLIPYLVWVSFAAALNAAIVALNR